MFKVEFGLLGRMDVWRSRFKKSRERVLEDDEEDNVNMKMAIDLFQDFIDYEPSVAESYWWFTPR